MMHILRQLRGNTFRFGVLVKPGDHRGQGTVEYLLVIGTISAMVTLLLWDYLQPTVKEVFLSLVGRIINQQ